MSDIEKHFRRLLSEGGGVSDEVLAIRSKGDRDLASALAEHGSVARYELRRTAVLPGSWIVNEGHSASACGEPVLLHPEFYPHGSGSRVQYLEIACPDVPNDAMRPINEAAEKIFEAWQRSIHGKERPALFTWEADGAAPMTRVVHQPRRVTPLSKIRAKWSFMVDRLRGRRVQRALYNHPRSSYKRHSLTFIERLLVRFV